MSIKDTIIQDLLQTVQRLNEELCDRSKYEQELMERIISLEKDLANAKNYTPFQDFTPRTPWYRLEPTVNKPNTITCDTDVLQPKQIKD